MPQDVEQVTVDAFLKTILRSGILDREQMQDGLRKVPRAERESAEAMAEHLVKNGKLTRFQAQKLLRGVTLGLLLGHFQILAPIGKGGMGTVYLARDTRSEQLLALKILPPSKIREHPRLLPRFRREMEMCRRVAHPHIAWTVDVGVHKGVYYIAMEYIPGKSLHRLVHEQGPLSVPRAAHLLSEVASAIDHTHHQGLIHRDIKPSNIMVTPNHHAKLLDLGLALVEGETGDDPTVIGGKGYIIGTMDYISPEQAEDATEVDPRSDIYSLGCTLYYALTGQAPFPNGTHLEKIQRHKTEKPMPLVERKPDIPAEFAAVVQRMMEKEPEFRYPTAAAVLEELKRWATAEPELPPDKPTDAGYVAAVEEVEAEETSAESIDLIPEGILVRSPDIEPEPPLARRSSSIVQALQEEPESSDSEVKPLATQTRISWLWVGVILLGCVAFAFLAGLMISWLRVS